jgi:hypothetical protein
MFPPIVPAEYLEEVKEDISEEQSVSDTDSEAAEEEV